MSPHSRSALSTIAVGLAAVLLSSVPLRAAGSTMPVVTAAPGEAGLRAALSSVADGGTVLLTTNVELQSSVRIERSVTIRYNGPRPWDNAIRGFFEGTLFVLAAPELRFEGIELLGSQRTDALNWETKGVATLVDCTLGQFRAPTAGDHWWEPQSTLRLIGVRVYGNGQAVSATRLEATNTLFYGNHGAGAVAYSALITHCQFEANQGDGLSVMFGTVRDSIFRHNSGFGLRFDPDPGILNLSGSLFYANAGGALLLREEARATVDNCTFTRHTGPPAVVVSEASSILFRHCTVTDNLVIGGGEPGLWPSFPKGGAFAIMSGYVELQNCLVADNPGDGAPHASGLIGQWIDGGGNVIGGPANLSYVISNDPLMPFELVPTPGSAAIDAGRLSDIVRDARGLSRLAGSRPDAGAIEAGATAVQDADGDGLPDSWEQFHSLDPIDASDAREDSDNDGSDALNEYLAGTDPADANSVLRILSFETWPNPLGGGEPYLQLSWNYVPGMDYRVQVSSDLVEWRDAPGYYWPGWSFQTEATSGHSFFRVMGWR